MSTKIAKISALLVLRIIAACLCASANTEDLLARRLSVSFYETPIQQALDEVARLAEFEWSYNAGILDLRRRVTLTARDWTVRETLREILGESYAYKSSGKYLILKKQKPPKTELSGVVRDPKTGERLANATVYDRKTLRSTTTDSSGYYKLRVKKNAEIVVARLGYRDTLLQVSSQSPRYQKIELSPILSSPSDSSASSEQWRKAIQQTFNQLEHFFAATIDKWRDLNVPDTFQRRGQVSFLPLLGSNRLLSGKVENDWSLNILAGQSAGVRQAEVGGIGNFTKNRVEGVQVGGVFNFNRGYCRGAQLAGVFNMTADSLTGVQAGGIGNVGGRVKGVQAGGIFNYAKDTLTGVQAGGIVNVAPQTSQKFLQVSGIVNVLETKPGATETRESPATGVQVAGIVNTADHLEGIQVSGIVNNARRMCGLQVGLINRAHELEGVQIGLLNWNGKRFLPFVNWGKWTDNRKIR